MGRTKATYERFAKIYAQLENIDRSDLPKNRTELAELLKIPVCTLMRVVDYYDCRETYLGTLEQQKELRHQRQSQQAKKREANRTPEQKEAIRIRASETSRRNYQNLSDEEKANYRQTHFLSGYTEEKEQLRRQRIKQTVAQRSQEEWNKIRQKQLEAYAKKTPEEIQQMRQKQGASLSRTINSLSPEQRAERNRKTGEGRKQAYKRETPEHRQQTQEKISATCRERYGADWYTLSPAFKRHGHMYSAINQQIAMHLEELGIKFEPEFTLGRYSYDFQIDHYLIEIDPAATHNLDWSPYGEGISRLSEDYHQQKTEFAFQHGYVCLHIFEWMSLDDYLSDILDGTLCIIKDQPKTFYYNLNKKTLVTEEEYLSQEAHKIVRIVGDGYKICKQSELNK